MRVLVTGANGFLGRHLVEGLAGAGHVPIGLALDETGIAPDIERHAVDVRDAAAVTAVVESAAPDAILHLAALSHVGESWERIPDYFAVNVLGTENVLAAASGRRFFFASSAEVYGTVPGEEQPIPESRPLAPRSPYALTKAAGERLALGAGASVIRLFNLLGAGQAANFALPSFARQLAAIRAGRERPVLRVGNLEARRDFVNVRDAVDAIVRLLTIDSPGGIYNLATGEAVSIREALERLRRLSGVETEIEIDPERLRPVDVPLLRGDASRLRALGWTPERGFEGALAELWAEAVAETEAAS